MYEIKLNLISPLILTIKGHKLYLFHLINSKLIANGVVGANGESVAKHVTKEKRQNIEAKRLWKSMEEHVLDKHQRLKLASQLIVHVIELTYF